METETSFSQLIQNRILRQELENALETGDIEELHQILSAGDLNLEDICIPDKNNSTILHTASKYDKRAIGAEMVTSITAVLFQELAPERFINFLNHQDNDKTTALAIAIKQRNEMAVETLLRYGADVNLRSKLQKYNFDPIEMIYVYMPQTILSIFDSQLEIEGYEDPLNPTVKRDFSVIIGVPGPSEKDKKQLILSETKLLSSILCLNISKSNRQKIIFHPLVQLFIHLKWNKVRMLIWTAMVYHILWSLLFTTYIFVKYHNPVNNNTDELYTNILPELHEEETILDTNLKNRLEISLLIMTTATCLNEIYKFLVSSDKLYYFCQFENPCRLLFIGYIYSIFIFNVLRFWDAFAVLLAWLLILAQCGRVGRMGVFMQIFVTVTYRIFLILLAFTPILIGFMFAFHLMTNASQFEEIWPPTSLIKIIVMMIGELEYEEIILKNPSTIPYPVATNLLFLVFVILVTIVLSNNLIAVAVKDTDALMEDAEELNAVQKLEQVHLMETLLYSEGLQNTCRCRIFKRFLKRFLVEPSLADETIDTEKIYLNDLPLDLQLVLKEFDEERILKDRENEMK